jgi:hypothetical protein
MRVCVTHNELLIGCDIIIALVPCFCIAVTYYKHQLLSSNHRESVVLFFFALLNISIVNDEFRFFH